MLLPVLIAALTLGAAASAAAQCKLYDINQQTTPIPSDPEGATVEAGGRPATSFVKAGNYWYFAAKTCATGTELFRTDGTPAGTVLVKDVRPGLEGSDPSMLFGCGATLFFAADDGQNGRELWRSDGTGAGTVLIKDINAGPRSSAPSEIECMGGKIYFAATTGSADVELWTSNGTSAGTILVKDIRTGGLGSRPKHLKRNSAGTEIYFQAIGTGGAELWKTGGTAATTVLVKDLWTSSSSSPELFVNFAGRTFFRARGPEGRELWSTQGTAATTMLVKDIAAGTTHGDPALDKAAVFGGKLYFPAYEPATGIELWETDGTPAGTQLAADIWTGTGWGRPDNLHVHAGALYMSATGTSGTELYAFNGTSASLVKDLEPGSGSSNPKWLASAGSRLVFQTATRAAGVEISVSDGTAAGTMLLKNIMTGTGPSYPRWTTEIGAGTVLFVATDPAAGRELWSTGGTPATTQLFKDVEPIQQTKPSTPRDLTNPWGDVLLFSADDGVAGIELWKAENGTVTQLHDIRTGPLSGQPRYFTPSWTGTQAIVFFTATEATTGTELWKTDGTPAGTQLVKGLRPGLGSTNPSDLAVLGGRVFFYGNVAGAGGELCVSDGTAAGTGLFKDIWPGSSSSTPREMTRCGDKLFFAANDGTHGGELWVSDGTPAGTHVIDLVPGSGHSVPDHFVCCGDKLFFTAQTVTAGRELWISDGTPAGTKMLEDIEPGARGSSPFDLTCCDSKLYFSANTSMYGVEPWISDGTTPGTVLLKNINTFANSSMPREFTCCDGLVYFSATLQAAGNELWVTDGTTAGTRMVTEIVVGPTGGAPRELVCAGKRVYFSAERNLLAGARGRELWVSDGTPAGTKRVCDIHPGKSSSNPFDLQLCAGSLWLSATSFKHGFELYELEVPGAHRVLLGDGSAKSYPTMDASTPVLGSTATLRGDFGPAGHVGAVLLGLPVTRPFPVPNVGCGQVLLPGMVILGAVAPPAWTLGLGIPNDNALHGVAVNAQVWWADIATVVPFETTNGVRLQLGT